MAEPRLSLGKRIRIARRRAGLSQYDLAERMDMAPSSVAGWEAGTHAIRTHKLGKLAKALDTTIADLLGA